MQVLPSVCPLGCPDRCALDVTVNDGRVVWRHATRNNWTPNALAPDHVDSLGGGACYNDARVEIERA